MRRLVFNKEVDCGIDYDEIRGLEELQALVTSAKVSGMSLDVMLKDAFREHSLT